MQSLNYSTKMENWEVECLFNQIVKTAGIGVNADCFDVLIPLAEKMIDHPQRDAADSARFIVLTLHLLGGTIAVKPEYYLGGGAGTGQLRALYDRVTAVVEKFLQVALQAGDQVVAARHSAIESVAASMCDTADRIFGRNSSEYEAWLERWKPLAGPRSVELSR